MRLRDMDRYLDFWNLMAYDYAGSWDTNAAHQANLYPSGDNPASTPFSTDRAISDYINAGVPANKIVLGMPMYGRAFTNTDGPGRPFSGVGEGSWEPGIWDYKALPRPGAQEREVQNIGATYSYDAGSRTMISYDTPRAAQWKADYVRQRGLGGGMWWESSGDKVGDGSVARTFM